MGSDRDTTNGEGGGIRLRLLDGGRRRASLDGGWHVGPGIGAGATRDVLGAGRGADGDRATRGAATEGAGQGAMRDVGREVWGAAPPAECTVVRSAVRAGDRHEPWTLPVSGALAALACVARTAGLDVELAVRLTVECALVCDDLRAAGVDLASLDAAAASERVGGELDAAAAAYLRRLTGRRGEAAIARRPAGFAPSGEDVARRPPPAGESTPAQRPAGFAPTGDGAATRRPGPLGEVVTVGLPVRLSARLLAADLDALVSAVPLERALAWETAAVLAGRTMSEWAPLTALRRGG